LKKPTIEGGGYTRPRRKTSVVGIPQGSPISPLLANIYMRRFVLGWKMFGLERTLGSRLVTYADDLVILCRRGKAEAALQRLREIMGKLRLTVSEEKTGICRRRQSNGIHRRAGRHARS
jgi:RNA-directed DNA polymerase